MTLSAPFAGLLAGFTLILRVLGAQVAARGAGRNPLPTPLVLATFNYLSRTLRRLAFVLARAQAGTPPSSPRPPGPPRPDRAPSITPRLPRGKAWLLPLVPMHAAAAGSQLQHLLAQPEMPALIENVPGLGRVLRPLAHMLGMTLPVALLLPPRPARVRVRRRAAPRVRERRWRGYDGSVRERLGRVFEPG